MHASGGAELEAFSSLEAVAGLLLRPGFRMHQTVAWLGTEHTEAGALHVDRAQHLSDLQKTLGARSGTRVANIREIRAPSFATLLSTCRIAVSCCQ